MKTKIIYITAGEIFENNNLIQSQVVKPALMYIKNGFAVEYICIEPIIKYYKNKILKRQKKQSSKNAITQLFPVYFFKSFLQTRKLFSYLHIEFLARSVSKRIIPTIKSHMELDKFSKIVFVCRSYLAASVALSIRDNIDNQYKDKFKIIFDTRSILSHEIPLTNGKKGMGIYGFLKQWEYELMSASDATLLTSQRGVDYFKLTRGDDSKLYYVPISGFAVNAKYQSNFSVRWANKKIAYVGSIGAWHSANFIITLLDYLTGKSGFSAEIISSDADKFDKKYQYPVYSVDHSKILEIYEQMLAIVVTGTQINNSYFQSQKVSIDFFSTKASEAFSIGVPLIVDEKLRELSGFILKHNCGVVYRACDDYSEIEFVNCKETDLKKMAFWKKISQNALRVGKIFRQDQIIKRQKEIINKI